MEPHVFRINAEPAGMKRPRAVRTKTGVMMHNDTRHVSHYLKQLIQAAVRCRIRKPLTGPVAVQIAAWFTRPKNKVRKTLPMPAEWHLVKPDGDNIAKLVLDALNGIAWHDDNAVCELVVRKRICAGTDKGYLQIIIEQLEGKC